MIRARIVSFVFVSSVLFFAGSTAVAQGNSNKQKDKKEYKDKKEKDKKYKQDKDYKDYRDNDRYQDRRAEERRSGTRDGGILGRVIYPERGVAGPRQLQGVPKGHYPPPGSCRIWYPNRPPGHQPAPTNCDNLRGIRLEPGAFVLHGDRAYDAEYDWRAEERRRPGSVGRDILDILFPGR